MTDQGLIEEWVHGARWRISRGLSPDLPRALRDIAQLVAHRAWGIAWVRATGDTRHVLECDSIDYAPHLCDCGGSGDPWPRTGPDALPSVMSWYDWWQGR